MSTERLQRATSDLGAPGERRAGHDVYRECGDGGQQFVGG